MTQEPAQSRSARCAGEETSGWAVGFILFAAIMMIMAGTLRAVLCVHRGGWLAGRRSIQDVKLATPRQLVDNVRHAAPTPPSKVEWATARLLELLRPAA